jgi:hypothetical protein
MKSLKAIALSLLGVLSVEQTALAINLYVPPENIRNGTLLFNDLETQAGKFYCNFTGTHAANRGNVQAQYGYFINLRNKPEITTYFRQSLVAMTVTSQYGVQTFDMSAAADATNIIEKSQYTVIPKQTQIKVGIFGDIFANKGRQRVFHALYVENNTGFSQIGEINCPVWDYPEDYNDSEDLIFLPIGKVGGIKQFYNKILKFNRKAGVRSPRIEKILKDLLPK